MTECVVGTHKFPYGTWVSIDVGQVASQLIGVLVGAGVTGGISVYTFRRQRLDAVAAEERGRNAILADEQRAREINASALARESLVKLLLLDSDPGQNRERELNRRLRGKGADYQQIITDLGPADEVAMTAWRRTRDGLILAIDAAAQDIGDAALRVRLEETCTMLRLYQGPEASAGQSENRTRYIAVSDGLGCLGAFRRGEQLPERSADYVSTYNLVKDYLEELQLDSSRG